MFAATSPTPQQSWSQVANAHVPEGAAHIEGEVQETQTGDPPAPLDEEDEDATVDDELTPPPGPLDEETDALEPLDEEADAAAFEPLEEADATEPLEVDEPPPPE